MALYKFGTVFRYNNSDYIYLAPDGKQIYAAKILGLRNSKMLNDTYLRRIKSNPNTFVLDNLVYSFVILETEEVKGRAAHFLNTGKENFNTSLFTTLNITLAIRDLRELKKEITKERCAIIRLKQLIKNVRI
jgi:hypothetical protein